MSAVVRNIRDVGPDLEMVMGLDWNIAGSAGTETVTVRYRVDYASVRDRGFGRNPDVYVLSVTFEDGTERTPLQLLPGQHDAICEHIETEELGE